MLKDIIRELHEGGDLEEQKKRFAELIKDVRPTEISEMEQKLIEEGMPESEVKRLCDVHVQVFKESLEGQPLPSAIPGHPLHTLTEENRALEKILARVQGSPGRNRARGRRRLLWQSFRARSSPFWKTSPRWKSIISRRKTSSFPLLESKGVSGPSKVMWAIHDDIRMMIREFRALLVDEKVAELVTTGRRLAEMLADMIYKEEKILLPMSLETLDENDWARRQERGGGDRLRLGDPGRWVAAGRRPSRSCLRARIPSAGSRP